jgi:hypothetical protein
VLVEDAAGLRTLSAAERGLENEIEEVHFAEAELLDTSQFSMKQLPTSADYASSLASEDFRMITGSSITVDGGATAKPWPRIPEQIGMS